MEHCVALQTASSKGHLWPLQLLWCDYAQAFELEQSLYLVSRGQEGGVCGHSHVFNMQALRERRMDRVSLSFVALVQLCGFPVNVDKQNPGRWEPGMGMSSHKLLAMQS